MPFKTVTTILTDEAGDLPTLDAAIELARQHDAHLDVICLGIDFTQPGFYYAGISAIEMQHNLSTAKATAEHLETYVTRILKRHSLPWSVRKLAAQSTGLSQFLAHRIRFSDLIVLPKPYGDGRGHEAEAVVESALFDASIPVFVAPDSYKMPDRFRRISIGWNESREALTAIKSALPLLVAADEVCIAIVDPPSHGPDRSDPGGGLSQMLARHGVRVEVSVLARTLPRVSDVLARNMADKDADLLVMGAYGHSRFRESILGGATRNMLQLADFPVLMAH